MSSLLPKILDRSHYRELFKKNAPWEAAVSHLVKKHKLKGDIQRGDLGSHIVYRVGDFWIKLMAPIFAGDVALIYRSFKLRIKSSFMRISPLILNLRTLES